MGIAVSHVAAGLFALAVGMVAGSEAAYAQANVLKECGSQYQAAKAANELAGQSWQEFLKACRARLAEQAKPAEEKPAEAKPAEAKPETPPPAAAEAPPAAKPAETAPPPVTEAKPPQAAPATEAAKPKADSQTALRERQKKCAAEWKTKKAEFKKAGSKITWPKYWSDCNKRLKAAGE